MTTNIDVVAPVVLNAPAASSRGVRPNARLAGELRAALARLLAEYTRPDGIDYAKLRGSEIYRAVQRYAQDLASFDPTTLATDVQRVAFWVNVYNALVIHAIVADGIRAGIVQDRSRAFFRQVGYLVGGQHASPHVIENGLLRRNRPSALQPVLPFAAGDARLAWMVERVEPRIHFALVCGARSCPPVRAFEAERLDAQLTLATRAYLAETTSVDAARGVVRLSPIFAWYADDFADSGAVLSFVRRFTDLAVPEDAVIEYLDYDWSLNAARSES